MRPSRCLSIGLILLCAVTGVWTAEVWAQDSLHQQIDQAISAKLAGVTSATKSDDAEFLRRVSLDLIGRIPSASETRAFLADTAADKRTVLIDRLLASAESANHLADMLNALLMERRGDNPDWRAYLQRSVAANKPWTQITSEVLLPNPADEARKGAEYFITKRLEHEGQQPIDYPTLARDVGRLFLGVDLQCCQCHDHLTVDDYKQQEFQGLLTVFQNVSVQGPRLIEKPLAAKTEFVSVFDPTRKSTGPRVPFFREFEIPQFAVGEEFAVAPDPAKQEPGVPKFSPLKKLAEDLPTAQNSLFVRNFANRLWFAMLGRGVVMPLDLHHSANPPSNPELLNVLAEGVVAQQFDIRKLLREIALSEAYQRTSLADSQSPTTAPESFAIGLEKHLSAEQLLRSILQATGPAEPFTASAEAPAQIDALRPKFVTAFANPPAQPEIEFAPSLKAALFLMNDKSMLELLAPKPGNLLTRLSAIDEPSKLTEELYLSVLSRLPTDAERAEVTEHLSANADRRAQAVTNLAWALLASTEFCLNH